MSGFLTFLLLGLGLGAIYALTATGMVLIYRSSGVLNFAQGAFAAAAAYTFVEVHHHVGSTLVAAAAGVALAAALGLVLHLTVMVRLVRASGVVKLVATVGVLIVVQQVLVIRYGESLSFVPQFLPHRAVTVGHEVTVGLDRFILAGIAAAVAGGLWAFYRFTRFGHLTTAVAENEMAVQYLGRRPQAIAAANWTLGAALGGLAGVLTVPLSGLSVLQLTLLVVPALAAALLGQFTSFPLTLVAALAIGAAQSELTRYVSQPGWAGSVPFLLIAAVLVIRGAALPARGSIVDRLPAVTNVAPRLFYGLVVAGVIGVTALSSREWASAITTTALATLVCLSLVVLTGMAGQLSLAQYAFAGVGALTAGQIGQHLGSPFPATIAIGAAVGGVCGILVGLPALRTRGVSLAVVTLGLGLAIQGVIFNNPDYTGGLLGLQVSDPELFGLDLSTLRHPQRFAVFCVLVAALAAWLVARLRNSATGRQMLAVRGSERATTASAINVVRVKLYAFALAAAMASLAGAIEAYRGRTVVLDSYTVNSSLNVTAFTVLGGVGYLLGAVFGGLQQPSGVLAELFSGHPGWQSYLILASGALLVVNLVLGQDGIVPLVRRQLRSLPMIGRVRRPPRPGTRSDAPSLDVRRAAQPAKGTAVLTARGLVARFGGVVAVNDVQLELRSGHVLGVIGPNGAGKTTLVDILSGFTRPTAGSINLIDRDVTRVSARARAAAGISRSFQTLEIVDDLTVRENIALACDEVRVVGFLSGLFRSRGPRLSAIAVRAVQTFGLEPLLDLRPVELPHSTRRLVGVARAIASNPYVVLLDEPAAGLDDRERAEVQREIRLLADDFDLAVLLIEHDVDMVMAVSDEVMAMDLGRVVAFGAPDEVRAHPLVRSAYLGEQTSQVEAAGHSDRVGKSS